MKKHTIAINALSALQGGGQVYISNLLRYADRFPDIRIYVFATPQFANLYSFPGIEVIRLDFASKNILTRTLWERWQMPRLLKQLEVNLVFCPGGTINFTPPKGCKTAVTFQNMLIIDNENRNKYPLGYVKIRLSLLEKTSRKSFRNANLVIFISEYAKKKVDEELPDRKGLSTVIKHGLDERFRTYGRTNMPKLECLPDDEYILYVSYLDRIKAQIEVVQAYHILCQKRPTKEKLLLVGPTSCRKYEKAVRKEIRRLRLEDKVKITGEIPYSDMPLVYHYAKAHIFASTCENCPNIVIESLGSGRPLFLSNRASMPELVGDAAVYFDPYNPDELASLLLQNLDDQQWMKEMGKKAFERSFLYSWEKTAKETFKAFGDLLETTK